MLFVDLRTSLKFSAKEAEFHTELPDSAHRIGSCPCSGSRKGEVSACIERGKEQGIFNKSYGS